MTGARCALIVANDSYDNEGLSRLLSAAADADALARVLGDPAIGGFDVRVVRDEPAHVIGTTIEDLFSDARPDDVLLLHFSCHGLKNESGELFFAARNTRPDRLGSTAVSADFVQRCVRASRSRSIVLLLDCCYGGAFSQGVAVRASGEVNVLDAFPGGRLGGGRGRAVITASSSMEYAFEGDHLAEQGVRQPSVFTSALVEGLATGEADRDEDGWVSLNELYEYVFDRVRARNPHQTPSRDVEMQGELYVARSHRRRVRAQPIPPDLRAAMGDPNMFSRLGAVTELRSRLLGDNLPVAAGAYEALAEIAGSDIRYVAEAASAALAEAAIRPAEAELRFGPGDPEVRPLPLGGPPLARSVAVRVSDAWIRVEEVPDGLSVSVRPERAGVHRGAITLRGAAGEVVVPVEAVAEPARSPVAEPAQPPAEPVALASPAVGPVVSAGPAVGPVVPAPEPVSPAAGRTTPAAAPAAPTSPAAAPLAPESAGQPPVVPMSQAHGRRAAVLWTAALCAGAAFVLLGAIVLLATSDERKLSTVTVALLGYTATWVLLTVVDPVPVGRRIATGLLAVLAFAPVVFYAVKGGSYFQYWSVRDTPLYWYALLVGPLEVLAALLGGARRTRALEIVSGCLGALLGLLVVIAVDRSVENALGVAVGLYLLLLGGVWIGIGLLRRRASSGRA